MRRKRTKTAGELAEKYGVNSRTIRNWKRAGAPLDDPARMAIWIASRRNLPPRLKLNKPAAKALPANSTIVETEGQARELAKVAPEPQATGAAAALERLQAGVAGQPLGRSGRLQGRGIG